MAAITPDQYVDSNAAGTNDGSSWTNAYQDIEYGIETGTIAADEVIAVAHNHSVTYGVSTSFFDIPKGVRFISVNSGTDVEQAGAFERCPLDLASDFAWEFAAEGADHSFSGIDFLTSDDITLSTANCTHRFSNCTWGNDRGGTGGIFNLTVDGGHLILDNVAIRFSNASQNFSVGGGSVLELNNCYGHGSNVLISSLTDAAGNGTTVLKLYNTDLSTILATNGDLLSEYILTDDLLQVTMRRCKLNTGFGLFTSAPTTNTNYEIDIAECHTADGVYYFLSKNGLGQAEADTTTYLNATYDGTTKFSAKLTAESEVSSIAPFKYKIATFGAQDLTTAKTVTIEATSDASLTDNDLWIELVVNNTTDEALGDIQTSQNSDRMAAGTALTTTGTGTWTSGDTEDYIITKDIGAIANVDNGTVEVWACVGVASIVANFDLPTIAVSS